MSNPSTGLNDDLNGVERPVSFDIRETGEQAQIVHSLAKWKRWALGRYGFQPGEGLWTDMNAVRRDEEMDNLHSIYVDQWDWEAILPEGRRDVEYFKETVRKIVGAVCDTQEKLQEKFPKLPAFLSRDVSFITTQELEDLYPDKTPKEREDLYVKEHKTTCVMQIGGKLASGIKHDGRAPDYDDWSLNGDILFWNDVLGCAFEVSSMGIRVDPPRWIASLPRLAARSAGSSRSTRWCFPENSRSPSAAGSGSPGCVCCCSKRRTSARFRFPCGIRIRNPPAKAPESLCFDISRPGIPPPGPGSSEPYCI